MAFIDLNKKKGVQDSAENLRKTVTEASEKLPDAVKNVNVGDSMKDLAKKSQNALDTLKSKGEESLAAMKEKQVADKKRISSALQKEEKGELMISIQAALRLIYCLIAVDGTVSPEEEEKFQEIGQEMDPDFSSYKDELIAECMKAASKPADDEEEYYDNIHDYAGDIIKEAGSKPLKAISGRLLLWDLLTVAYSEDEYSSSEKRLIRYISKGLGVEYAVVLEMEHTVRTLLAINKEEEWLKHTDRPYAVVEERVNELSDRRNTVLAGAKALLAD